MQSKLNWQKAGGILAAIFASRMLGMFMIFPVFSLYASELTGNNPVLIGLALGIYGLTQGVLQIPFGWLSDRVGRKPLMVVGLSLFAVGSVLAAQAESIYAMIFARAVQGMGAISAVMMAYAADFTPSEKLGKVMAMIGASIGGAFLLSLVISPILAAWIGVRGIFYVIAALACAGILALGQLPKVALSRASVLQSNAIHRGVWQASSAIFLLHAVFSGAFLLLPKYLLVAGIASQHHWWLYLPANVVAMGMMRYKAVIHPIGFAISFMILTLSLLLLPVSMHKAWLLLSLSIFFIGFYRLETGLPHWVANLVGAESRGKAMGVFSTAQFAGSFFGAALSGWVWRYAGASVGEQWVFMMLAVLSALMAIIMFYWAKKSI